MTAQPEQIAVDSASWTGDVPDYRQMFLRWFYSDYCYSVLQEKNAIMDQLIASHSAILQKEMT